MDLAPAHCKAPEIPGLYFFPELTISEQLERVLIQDLIPYFSNGSNQVMLFGRSDESLPPFIPPLLVTLSILLKPHLPLPTYDLLFPSYVDRTRYPSRQVIFNYYSPGQGISPHIDLPARYGDGIIVVSLASGIVMDFVKQGLSSSLFSPDPTDGSISSPIPPPEVLPSYSLWLPPRSIVILEGEARYQWTHGIAARKDDFVMDENSANEDNATWFDRTDRLSITIRWMLQGADVVGQ